MGGSDERAEAIGIIYISVDGLLSALLCSSVRWGPRPEQKLHPGPDRPEARAGRTYSRSAAREQALGGAWNAERRLEKGPLGLLQRVPDHSNALYGLGREDATGQGIGSVQTPSPVLN